MDANGSAALVTGGASGLGLATAAMLQEAGAGVVILDLPGSGGAEAAEELGERARFVPGDACSANDVTRALDKAGELGAVRIAVNCAGTGNALRTLSKNGPLPLDQFRRIVEINLVSTFNVIRLAAERMATADPIGDE